MINPLFNILVRTSNRPKFFARCYESIQEQDYKNVRLIVSYDDEFTQQYVSTYEIDATIDFNRNVNWKSLPSKVLVPGIVSKPFPPNEYFNKMMQYTKPGYILYLDDDDKFSSADSLGKIAAHISGTDQMLLWRVQFPGYVEPDDAHFGKMPQYHYITSSGFAFHTRYIPYARWDGYTGGDYRTAISLYSHIPQKVFIDEVLTALQKDIGKGSRNDLF